MKHVKLFEAFVSEDKLAYGDEYNETGFNLMQKDLEQMFKQGTQKAKEMKETS